MLALNAAFIPQNGPACPCITMFPNSIRKEGFRCTKARIINVKKILFALLLSLLLLLSLSAGAAEQTAAFSLSYVNGAVGGTVEVALTCDANPASAAQRSISASIPTRCNISTARWQKDSTPVCSAP